MSEDHHLVVFDHGDKTDGIKERKEGAHSVRKEGREASGARHAFRVREIKKKVQRSNGTGIIDKKKKGQDITHVSI